MRDKFEIHQTISLFDFYKGGLYLWRKNKKLMFFIYFGPLILLILGVLNILLSPKPGQVSVSVLSQVLFLLAFTICFYLVGFFIILLLIRVLKPGHFKNTIYTFNHWGMHKKAGASEYTMPWKGFIKWNETKSFFFLYVTDNDAHIISKKVIKEPEQKELRDFLIDRFTQFSS
jgi:YcxB-like protein